MGSSLESQPVLRGAGRGGLRDALCWGLSGVAYALPQPALQELSSVQIQI